MAKKKPEWRIREQLAGILESALADDATVEFDKKMKRLDGTGQRQCDAIIRSGKPPRELVSLVEVQRRKKKYGVESFDTHLAMLKQIGAHHLIVVSAAGFTRSVIEHAKREGPRVRLMLLSELEGGLWPVGLHSDFKTCSVNALTVHGAHFEEPAELGSIPFVELRFSSPKDPLALRSFSDLVEEAVIAAAPILFRLAPGTHRLPIVASTAALGWRLHRESRAVGFTLVLDATLGLKHRSIPMRAEGYREAVSGEPHGWVVSAVSSEGGYPVDIRLILVPNEDGRSYRAVSLQGNETPSAVFVTTEIG